MSKDKEFDIISKPSHYNQTRLEPIDVINDWGLKFNLGNVIKYIARYRHKGTPIRDLEKANWYLNDYITRLYDGEVELETIDIRRVKYKPEFVCEMWKEEELNLVINRIFTYVTSIERLEGRILWLGFAQSSLAKKICELKNEEMKNE